MRAYKNILPSLILIFTCGIGATVFGTYISPYLSSLGFSNSTISYIYAAGPLSAVLFYAFFLANFLIRSVGKK